MGDFLDDFSEQRPRESSGASSSNRFDYQKDWAFCELINLQLEGEDYLMVFEHHEDIVVLNSELSPSSAKFYQVKSKKSNNWTINALVKNKTKDELSSIVGKLYGNQSLFPDNTEKIIFSSNQGVSNILACGSKGLEFDVITFEQLTTGDKEKVWSAVKGENDDFCDLEGLNKVTLARSALKLEDHVQLTKGKLVDFFNTQYPDRPAHVALAYQTIFDEIRRKTNFEEIPKNREELRKSKSISKTEFSYMTGLVAQSRTTNELWLEAVQHLSASGIGPFAQRKIKQNWDKYTVDKMNVANEQLLAIQSDITQSVSKQINVDENANMDVFMENSLSTIKDKSGYSDDYIKAATIYEVIHYDPVSSANSEFKDETK